MRKFILFGLRSVFAKLTIYVILGVDFITIIEFFLCCNDLMSESVTLEKPLIAIRFKRLLDSYVAFDFGSN